MHNETLGSTAVDFGASAPTLHRLLAIYRAMSNVRRNVVWQWLARFWPGLVLGIYVLVCFGRFIPADYASSDWWPVLATNHLETLEDVPRIFTEPNAVRDVDYVRQTALDYRPLGTASYAIDYKLWGFDHPWGYQLTNLLIHGLVVFATYRLARELGLARWSSLLAAMVFTSHPGIVATEPGIGRRLDTMSAAFGLFSILLLLRGGRWRLAAAALLFGCSVLAKETSLVMLPLATGILAIRHAPIGRMACLVAPACLAIGLRLLVLGSLGGYGTAGVPSTDRLSDYRETLVHFLEGFASPGPEVGTYAEMTSR